ncbi:hypothetical protein DL96DRAFT_1675364 [Flagelloscypha sp. PMI_526]|nr:hypothetical protein DL96DRAFT_1675364 [Flagelloscypha sp. PMI_526]
MWALRLLPLACLASLALAQSSTPTATPSVTVSLSSGVSTIVRTTTRRNGNANAVQTTTILSSFSVNVTSTLTPTSSATSAAASASSTPPPIVLETKVDPAFGVLGALLILTGLPSAFMGHKNRWTSFFIIGFYTLALVCFVLITKFGILQAVNPPSKTIRGIFILACGVAGVVGGGAAIFFWKGARYFIGAWGGFAFALWVQCFRNGGLVREIGYRWIMFIGSGVVGFTLCTIPKMHYHVLLVSTAFVGATATILGADCYTTAGLKEFYMWNLGFPGLFPKFTSNGIRFPVSQTMQIELGMIAAVALMGSAVQFRILGVLQHKLHEIQEEQKKRDEEAEVSAAERFTGMDREREAWEKDHPSLAKHDRNESGLSGMPLMKDVDHTGKYSPTTDASFTMYNADGRQRTQSGYSELLATPGTDDDARRASRKNQPAGMLPALDVGLDLGKDVPDTFISTAEMKKSVTEPNEREKLLNEIGDIRRSIEVLRSETGSAGTRSRQVSLSSRLSLDAGNALTQPSHLRPPRETGPRVQSMELSTYAQGSSIARPASAPLRDDDWDNYVRERKLMQPPSGSAAPIATTPSPGPTSRSPMPQAVADAMKSRQNRESRYLQSSDDSDDLPLSQIRGTHSRSNSLGAVAVLPPKKSSPPLAAPQPRKADPRVKTFEELTERHREKMRDLQGPLTEAAKEQAAVDAAKARWQRSKEAEKRDVARRQAEQANKMEEKRRRGEDDRTGRKMGRDSREDRHSRSLSADKLAALGGGSSKRLSSMKVLDWQRHQEEETRDKRNSSVPFPDEQLPKSHGRSRSRGSRELL